MTTLVACPAPILRFTDNAGNPAVGGTVLTQVGGVNYPTYQDVNGNTPLPNPIPLNSRGEVSTAAGASAQLFLTPNTAYTFTLSDAAGNQLWVATYINGIQLTAETIAAELNGVTDTAILASYLLTAGEIAANVVPSNYAYPPGDGRRYGMVCDSATDNTAAFTNALAANAGYFPVDLYGVPGKYFKLTARVPAPAETEIRLHNGAELNWTATTATGSVYPATSGGVATRPGIEIEGNGFRLTGQGSLVGPSVGVYTALEIGIYAQGGALGTPRSHIYVGPGISLYNWGYAGIFGQFTFDTEIVGTTVYGCGYIGIGFISAIRSRVIRNEVYGITPGTSGNAYGIIHSYDSSNNSGNSRPGAGGETNPYSLDCIVAHNFVHDIPLWAAINWHGGFDGIAHDNNVYNCEIGIQVGSAPNSGGTNYGGQNMRIHDNLVDINQYDGSASTTSGVNAYGVAMSGGNGGNSTDYHAHGNTLIGYGLSTLTAYALFFELITRGSCQGNILEGWSGYGIYINGNNDTVVSGNVFGAVGTSVAGDACIYSAAGDNSIITGNMHRPQSGTAAHFGAFINTAGDNPYLLGMNDFDGASVAPYGQAGSYLLPVQMRGNSDAIPQVIVAAVASNTVSISGVGYAKEVFIILNTTAANTINSITGSFIGQRVTLYQESNETTTFSRTNAKLAAGANWVGTQYSMLMLMCVSLSGGVPQFVELGRVVGAS